MRLGKRPKMTGKSKNVALVTGATSGLGLEFAHQIDALGEVDEIWLLARNEAKLQEVAKQLKTPAIAVPCDISNTADIGAVTSELGKDGLNVKYLVNSAGFGRFGAWDDVETADEESMIDLNCKGLVTMTKECLPYMSRGSHIIQIASAAAFVPLPDMNVYAATKAFVLRYTRALRWELHFTGITATALCPTWVKTGFESNARKSKDGQAVKSMLFAQDPSTVVSRALMANKLHFAVCCASIPSLFLRICGKVVPNAINMAGWEVLRRL